jgi:hypothetical protein
MPSWRTDHKMDEEPVPSPSMTHGWTIAVMPVQLDEPSRQKVDLASRQVPRLTDPETAATATYNQKSVSLVIPAKNEGPQGVRRRNSDNSRLREVLGWEPSIDLETSLLPAYRWSDKQANG